MIDNYLLEGLVSFAKYGTLSATAKHLLVTQPSLTRAMQKLEEDLQVQLFDRTPNRIFLNKTGQFAAEEAAKILAAQKQFIENTRHFNNNQQQIRLASSAPGPLLILESAEGLQLEDHLISPKDTERVLLNREYSLIISGKNIQTADIQSRYLGSETLAINLDSMTAAFSGQQVTFADIDGLSFITLAQLGPWQSIINTELPKARFIPQETYENLSEILSHSSFPFFTTNLSSSRENRQALGHRRREFQIADQSATIEFYISYLKENQEKFSPAIEQIREIWKRYQ